MVVGSTIASKLLHYCFPFIIIIFCYLKIYLVIRKQRRSRVTIGEITDAERTEVFKKKTERGRACTISLILTCFFICYAPSTIWIIIRSESNFCEDNAIIDIVSIWTAFTLFLSTIINPIVYYLRSKEVRTVAKRFIKCT